MKKIALLLFLLTTTNLFSQKNNSYTFGKITDEEINLKTYALDTTANAIVLYESGITNFTVKGRSIVIRTKHYYKIKLFNNEGFKHATFKIPIYNNRTVGENVISIKAITHNKQNRTFLSEKKIFRKKINENWKEVKFTLPNLKSGCVIEVEYIIESPFKFNLTGWKFQSDIPKKISKYKASIPGNYRYNRILNGYLKLKTNSSEIKKECFRVPAYSGVASCEVVTYVMENIPAFVDEDYMTNRENFISKIKFELAELLWFNGSKTKYTTTWKAVDKEFKTDKNIGGQFKKTKYLKAKIPSKIKSLNSDLDKAKAIYNFVQNHFTWNGMYSIFKKIKVKSAFENKIGNVGEINISLVNALKFVGLDVEIVLISTRNNGTPTKLHPVITDFNYVIAKVNINNKYYLLDATEKLIPFGLLPYRCLNGSGRVMNFKKESYWINIIPEKNSKTKLTVSLNLNKDGTITGKLRKSKFGYDALNRRKEIENDSEDDIILEFENNFDNLEVINYKIENKTNINKPIIETFELLIENTENFTSKYLSPFFDEKFTTNPFKQKNRLYPVDFGYPRNYIVNFILEIPDNYAIQSFPKSKSIALPQNGGIFNFLIKHQNSKIVLNSFIKIDKPRFYNSEYEFLKEFFKIIINSQKTPIALKKISL